MISLGIACTGKGAEIVILTGFENVPQTRGIFLPLFINDFILLWIVMFFEHFLCNFE